MSRVLPQPSDTPVLKEVIVATEPGDPHIALLTDGKIRVGFLGKAVLESDDHAVLAAAVEAKALDGDALKELISNLIAQEIAASSGVSEET
jgi:hypothetical protein